MEKCFISDESFGCDLCGKEFQSQFVLRGHKKTHTNSKVKIKISRKRKADEMLEQSVDESTDVIEEDRRDAIMEVHPKLNCDQCSFLGFSELGLNAHKTVEHCEDGGIKWFVKLARLNFIPK